MKGKSDIVSAFVHEHDEELASMENQRVGHALDICLISIATKYIYLYNLRCEAT